MYKRDFILRMIEMLGEVIARILGLISKGDYQLASQNIENAYSDFLKQDAAFFRAISKEKLTDELIKKHNYTYDHLEILSELFFAEAELLYAKGNQDESLEYYEKALLLNKFVLKESRSFSFAKQSKIFFLQNRIVQLKESIS
jgi:tetratricopeptide (TPR) repeat protein